MHRAALVTLGCVCVALGVIGIALPLLPTTPFLLVAIWAFARSSPKLDAWLRGHKTLGPYIEDWDRYGIVPVKAKVLAVLMMTASLTWFVLATEAPWYAKLITGLALACVALWLTTRPSQRSS